MVKSRVPKTRYPRKIEDWYAKEIKKMVRRWQRGAQTYLKFYLKQFVNGGSGLKLDADDPTWIDRLNQQLELMAFSIEQSDPNSKEQMTKLATRFVRSLNSFSYDNVRAQVAIVGLDPISDNPAIRDYVKGKIGENVSLIKSMRTNYFDSLEKDIYRSITSGGGTTSIAQAIVKRTHMANDHAELIANDQSGSIISQLDSYRAKKAGAERYIWRSMEDSRVRPKHQELDGKDFKYGDPQGGDDGQLPGEPIRCRCVAEPIF